MVNSCAVCGCCTRTDIVREHLEDTLRICDVSAKGLFCEYHVCDLTIFGSEHAQEPIALKMKVKFYTFDQLRRCRSKWL